MHPYGGKPLKSYPYRGTPFPSLKAQKGPISLHFKPTHPGVRWCEVAPLGARPNAGQWDTVHVGYARVKFALFVRFLSRWVPTRTRFSVEYGLKINGHVACPCVDLKKVAMSPEVISL